MSTFGSLTHRDDKIEWLRCHSLHLHCVVKCRCQFHGSLLHTTVVPLLGIELLINKVGYIVSSLWFSLIVALFLNFPSTVQPIFHFYSFGHKNYEEYSEQQRTDSFAGLNLNFRSMPWHSDLPLVHCTCLLELYHLACFRSSLIQNPRLPSQFNPSGFLCN